MMNIWWIWICDEWNKLNPEVRNGESIHKIKHYLQSNIKVPSQDNYRLKSVSARKLKPVPSRSKSIKKAFFPCCIDEWNKLNPEVRSAKSTQKFKNQLKLKNCKILSIISLEWNYYHAFKIET